MATGNKGKIDKVEEGEGGRRDKKKGENLGEEKKGRTGGPGSLELHLNGIFRR